MSALICGSIAYDTIMVYPGRFGDAILPDKIHMLNVAFEVPKLRREFGGCAGNIAYTLHLLGGPALPCGTIGEDGTPYQERFEHLGIDQRHVMLVPETHTAQCFITTDVDDNQITAFHPGAMNESHRQRIPENGFDLAIVAPDGRAGMVQHAQLLAERGRRFIFDPGQSLPLFDGDDLLDVIDKATWVAVNDYEASLMCDRTGRSIEELAQRCQALIVTRGREGSRIHVAGSETIELPVVPASAEVDPTGCGDAYRAGLLYGLLNGCDWSTTGRIAALAGSIKIAHGGTQNHSFGRDEFFERFHAVFGYRV